MGKIRDPFEVCKWCNGSGNDGGGYDTCPDCEGTGYKYGHAALAEQEKLIEEAYQNHLKGLEKMNEYVFKDGRKKSKTITNIGLNMFPFTADFTRIRYQEKDKQCHLCGTPFKDNEMLSLAMVKGEKNHLICEDCTNLLINQGVPFVDKGKNSEEVTN